MSRDEALVKEIGCDSVGTVPCNETFNVMCFDGTCALFIAETQKRCEPRCKCYLGYFGSNCQYRNSSLVATAGILGGFACILLILLLVFIAWCCLRMRSKRQLEAAREAESSYTVRPVRLVPGPDSEWESSRVWRFKKRPRSGYYEHELLNECYGDEEDVEQGNTSGPVLNQETERLHGDDLDGPPPNEEQRQQQPNHRHQPEQWQYTHSQHGEQLPQCTTFTPSQSPSRSSSRRQLSPEGVRQP
nr:unnamed protein product [Spirometra erinaceieuropaei]